MSRHRDDLAAARDRIASLQRDLAEREAEIARLQDDETQRNGSPDAPAAAEGSDRRAAPTRRGAGAPSDEIPAGLSSFAVYPASLRHAYQRRDELCEQARLRCEREIDRINSEFGEPGYDEARVEERRLVVLGEYQMAQQAAERQLQAFIARRNLKFMLMGGAVLLVVLVVGWVWVAWGR